MTTAQRNNQQSLRKKAKKMVSRSFKKFSQIKKNNHNGEFGENRMKKMDSMNLKKPRRKHQRRKKDGINLKKSQFKKIKKMMALMILKKPNLSRKNKSRTRKPKMKKKNK